MSTTVVTTTPTTPTTPTSTDTPSLATTASIDTIITKEEMASDDNDVSFAMEAITEKYMNKNNEEDDDVSMNTMSTACSTPEKMNNDNNYYFEEPKSAKAIISQMAKHSDGTNLVKECVQSFKIADGVELHGDIIVRNKLDGLIELKQMIEIKRNEYIQQNIDKGAGEGDEKEEEEEGRNHRDYIKWEFQKSPYKQFDKTLDDLYLAFIQWAIVDKEKKRKKNYDNDNNDDDGITTTATNTRKTTSNDSHTSTTASTSELYNISKAFRRLEYYANWIEDTDDVLTSEPLTAESAKRIVESWYVRSGVDKIGHYVWFVDMGKIDFNALKTQYTNDEQLRAFVWFAHHLIFDDAVQQNGIIFAENLANANFYSLMTVLPLKLRLELKKLTVGVMPIKVKKIYMLDMPLWYSMFVKFTTMFMSKKIKSRIDITSDWNRLQNILGKDCIPKNFGKLEGSVEVDPMVIKYFNNTTKVQ